MRTRQLLALALAVSIWSLVAGCAGHSSPRSVLRIELSGGFHGDRTYDLRCGPARGTAPDPAALCDALEHDPSLIRPVRGRDHSCPFGPPTTHVTGTFGGHAVNATFSVCRGGQEDTAARWAELARY